jgi:hypothetical protein
VHYNNGVDPFADAPLHRRAYPAAEPAFQKMLRRRLVRPVSVAAGRLAALLACTLAPRALAEAAHPTKAAQYSSSAGAADDDSHAREVCAVHRAAWKVRRVIRPARVHDCGPRRPALLAQTPDAVFVGGRRRRDGNTILKIIRFGRHTHHFTNSRGSNALMGKKRKK